ncbi:hypothetical protein EKE90_18835 [Escherichia coli]|nr:hypothetical protein [Escherichia coli]
MTLSFFITVIPDHDKPQPPGCLLGRLTRKGVLRRRSFPAHTEFRLKEGQKLTHGIKGVI